MALPWVLSSFTLASDTPDGDSLPSDLLQLPLAVHQEFGQVIKQEQEKHGRQMLAYIHLQKGKKGENWLLSLTLDDSAGDGVAEDGGTRVFSSTGREFVFINRPGTLRSSLLGPLKPGYSIADRTDANLSVNRENLRLGLNQLSGFFDALHAIRARDPEGKGRYQGKGEPFPPDPMLSDQTLLEEVGLTAEVERAFLGSLPALLEFFGIIYETPGLRNLLREMIPARRMLGMLNPFSGRNIGFSYGDPVPYVINTSASGIAWDMLSVIPVELKLNGKTVIRISLYATEPEGPLEATAGIVMLVVDSVPAGKSRMIIRCEPGVTH